jgi:transposase
LLGTYWTVWQVNYQYLIGFNFSLWVEISLKIIRSIGVQRGKNDKVDAERIAYYAKKNQQEAVIFKAPRKEVDKIRNLLSLREKLVTTKASLLRNAKDER